MGDHLSGYAGGRGNTTQTPDAVMGIVYIVRLMCIEHYYLQTLLVRSVQVTIPRDTNKSSNIRWRSNQSRRGV